MMVRRTDVSFLLNIYNLIGDNNYEGKKQCRKYHDKKYHGVYTSLQKQT